MDLVIPLSDDELAALEAIAQREGRSTEEFARAAIRGYLDLAPPSP